MHKEICKTRSNPYEGGSTSYGVTFSEDVKRDHPTALNLDPYYGLTPSAERSPNMAVYKDMLTLQPDIGGSQSTRLHRSKTLPHGERNRSQRMSRHGSQIRRHSPSHSRQNSSRRSHSDHSKPSSLKTDALLQRKESQRSEKCPNDFPMVLSPTSGQHLHPKISPRSSYGSRASSNRSYGHRRQSAWSGQQMRGDFSDVLGKYANPETELTVSAVLIVGGTICLIISVGNNVNAVMVIGIVFLVFGVLMLLAGMFWYYNKTRKPTNGDFTQQSRPKLYTLSPTTAECQSMMSEHSPPASPAHSSPHSPRHSPHSPAHSPRHTRISPIHDKTSPHSGRISPSLSLGNVGNNVNGGPQYEPHPSCSKDCAVQITLSD